MSCHVHCTGTKYKYVHVYIPNKQVNKLHDNCTLLKCTNTTRIDQWVQEFVRELRKLESGWDGNKEVMTN